MMRIHNVAYHISATLIGGPRVKMVLFVTQFIILRKVEPGLKKKLVRYNYAEVMLY